jgi:hypothetical protein
MNTESTTERPMSMSDTTITIITPLQSLHLHSPKTTASSKQGCFSLATKKGCCIGMSVVLYLCFRVFSMLVRSGDGIFKGKKRGGISLESNTCNECNGVMIVMVMLIFSTVKGGESRKDELKK